MTASIPRRLSRIKRLMKEYYGLDCGSLIEKHTELLRAFDVRGSKHKGHPHKNLRVYISRKSLKHFVESRKKEFSKNHTTEQTLIAVFFAIDNLQETITHFDFYEYEPPIKHFYTKDYSHIGKPSLRVLLELKDSKLEISSIHFQKYKKKK